MKKLLTLMLVLSVLIMGGIAAGNQRSRARSETPLPAVSAGSVTTLLELEGSPALRHALESNRLARTSW